jgi:hypothetical protein
MTFSTLLAKPPKKPLSNKQIQGIHPAKKKSQSLVKIVLYAAKMQTARDANARNHKK